MPFLFLSIAVSANGQQQKDSVYSFVEIPPAFPGGEIALSKYLVKNINYPRITSEGEIPARVRIQFIIDAQGCVYNVRPMDTAKISMLDIEVMRVLKMMSAWQPGKHNGKNVAVQYYLPVFVCPRTE